MMFSALAARFSSRPFGLGRSLFLSRPGPLVGKCLALDGHETTPDVTRKFTSRSKASSIKSYRPRRRPNKNYRPFKAKNVMERSDIHTNPQVLHHLGEMDDAGNEDERDLGIEAAQFTKELRRGQAIRNSPGGDLHDEMEEGLRISDYLTAEPGSTEEQIFERRAMEHMTDEEKKEFEKNFQELKEKAEKIHFEAMESDEERTLKPPKPKKGAQFDGLFMTDEEREDFYAGDSQDPEDTNFEFNRRAHGEWTNMVVDVRRGIHLWRGGRLETYRAMVVGGNLNGCGGFGVGSHKEPLKAVAIASRKARRNIFFVDRYQGNGLTRDLVGTQNSTKVIIRAVDNGIRGNPLMKEILLRFGIRNASCKAHGKRHLWNVVRATFKALCTHESMEDICMKRGRRILSIDRALRLKV